MPRYRAYGLVVESELELPELSVTDSGPVTLTIREGKVQFAPPDTTRVICRPVTPKELIVYYRGVGTAFVHDGREITLQPTPGSDRLAVRMFLLHQVMAMALLQRGYLLLHAGAVVVDGRALAFLGQSGRGKSTMVGVLHHLGNPVLCDDVLAIDTTDPDRPMAQPGIAKLKLTEPARALMAGEIISEEPLRDRPDKTVCTVRGSIATEAVELRKIILLEPGQDVELLKAMPGRAVIELVRQTYGAELLPHIGRDGSHFEQCAAIARKVKFSLLKRPMDFRFLPRVSDTVLHAVRQGLP